MRKIDENVERVVRAFLARIGDSLDVQGAMVFGSRACGNNRIDSDIDLAVLLPGKPQKSMDAIIEMNEHAYDILLETELDINPIAVWQIQLTNPELHANPDLIRNILRDGVRL